MAALRTRRRGGGLEGGGGLEVGDGRLGGGRLEGGGGRGSGSFADAVGIHRLFRDWVGRCGAIDQACGIEVVPPNNVVSVVKAVERPDVVCLRGGDAIEAPAHIRLDLHFRPRVVPEPGS